MLKKLTKIGVLCLVLFISTAKVSFAQTQTVEPGVCVSVYGGGVVCGAKAPEEHKPVAAGLAENIALVGTFFLAASGAVLYFSRKFRTLKSQTN